MPCVKACSSSKTKILNSMDCDTCYKEIVAALLDNVFYAVRQGLLTMSFISIAKACKRTLMVWRLHRKCQEYFITSF